MLRKDANKIIPKLNLLSRHKLLILGLVNDHLVRWTFILGPHIDSNTMLNRAKDECFPSFLI